MHHSQPNRWEGGSVKYGCQKQTFFPNQNKNTKEVTCAFIITIQFHIAFTTLSIQSKGRLIVKGKEVRRKAKKKWFSVTDNFLLLTNHTQLSCYNDTQRHADANAAEFQPEVHTPFHLCFPVSE